MYGQLSLSSVPGNLGFEGEPGLFGSLGAGVDAAGLLPLPPPPPLLPPPAVANTVPKDVKRMRIVSFMLNAERNKHVETTGQGAFWSYIWTYFRNTPAIVNQPQGQLGKTEALLR